MGAWAMSPRSQGPGRPWYREPLVWLVLGIPASAVVMGVVMLVLSVESYDGLVADDYYRRGLEINRAVERARAAATLGLEARVEIDPGTATVRATLTATDPRFQPPDTVALRLSHATRAARDIVVDLTHGGGGRYVQRLPELDGGLPSGRWYLRLETDAWRVDGALPDASARVARLLPEPG